MTGSPHTAWPSNFVWGVSTSSYQIEGAASEGGRAPSIWDTRCRQSGKVVNGDTGDVACDHYHRYAEDVALMKTIGVHAYRFSVSWPRVLPLGRGAANETGLAFYDRLIDTLLEANIEPWLCLYHWDLPQALEDLGGWTSRDSIKWFADYAELVGRRYGDRVKRFATFNEFSVFTLFGYAFDWAAPGLRDRTAHLKAIHHVNLAHGAAVDVLRSNVPQVSIGAIHNRQRVLPARDTVSDLEAAALLDEFWNRAFPDAQLLGIYPGAIERALRPYVRDDDMDLIRRPIDWFGLNHYGPIFAKSDPEGVWGFGWGDAPQDAPKTEIGWPIFPEAFRDELIEVTRRYRLPIYVTENGFGGDDRPDANGEIKDHKRILYLRTYTNAMRDALNAGADVQGYFVWSLLDNFEWGNGYSQRFGLVYVDYETQRRVPKLSARWYADHIRSTDVSAAPAGGEKPASSEED